MPINKMRSVVEAIQTIEDPKAKLQALNSTIQSLHFGHNEVRRLTPMFFQIVTDILAPGPIAPKLPEAPMAPVVTTPVSADTPKTDKPKKS